MNKMVATPRDLERTNPSEKTNYRGVRVCGDLKTNFIFVKAMNGKRLGFDSLSACPKTSIFSTIATNQIILKELAYYCNNDLCSIKGIEHSNLLDIAFMQGLFQNIIDQTKSVSIEARRSFSGSEYTERELNRLITERPELIAQIKDEELKLNDYPLIGTMA